MEQPVTSHRTRFIKILSLVPVPWNPRLNSEITELNFLSLIPASEMGFLQSLPPDLEQDGELTLESQLAEHSILLVT